MTDPLPLSPPPGWFPPATRPDTSRAILILTERGRVVTGCWTIGSVYPGYAWPGHQDCPGRVAGWRELSDIVPTGWADGYCEPEESKP